MEPPPPQSGTEAGSRLTLAGFFLSQSFLKGLRCFSALECAMITPSEQVQVMSDRSWSVQGPVNDGINKKMCTDEVLPC